MPPLKLSEHSNNHTRATTNTADRTNTNPNHRIPFNDDLLRLWRIDNSSRLFCRTPTTAFLPAFAFSKCFYIVLTETVFPQQSFRRFDSVHQVAVHSIDNGTVQPGGHRHCKKIPVQLGSLRKTKRDIVQVRLRTIKGKVSK
jgi:hypothetical protein